MTSLRKCLPFSLILLLAAPHLGAQQALQRDPQAATLLARSFAAMGGANLPAIQDTQATAQVTAMQDGTPATSATTFKTLGTRMLRIESDTPAGRSPMR